MSLADDQKAVFHIHVEINPDDIHRSFTRGYLPPSVLGTLIGRLPVLLS